MPTTDLHDLGFRSVPEILRLVQAFRHSDLTGQVPGSFNTIMIMKS